MKNIKKKMKNIKKNEKEKKKFLKLIGVITEINIQNGKYIKNIEIEINGLKNKLELITNAYKVLYIRKLANIFLNELYERYSKKMEAITFKVGKNSILSQESLKILKV